MREAAEILKALSDETRLEIIALLMRAGELCVCDVEAVLGITQSKSSRHLRYLLNAGLVENKREGIWMHYRVRSDLDEATARLLYSVERMFPEEKLKTLREDLGRWLERKKDEPPTCSGC